MLALFNFDKWFEVIEMHHDYVLRVFLTRMGDRSFFYEKLSSFKNNYSTYDLEFYVIVQALIKLSCSKGVHTHHLR